MCSEVHCDLLRHSTKSACFLLLPACGSATRNHTLIDLDFFVGVGNVKMGTDSVLSWPLVDQATGTMTQYPTQSHYPDTELISHSPIVNNTECRVSKLHVSNL